MKRSLLAIPAALSLLLLLSLTGCDKDFSKNPTGPKNPDTTTKSSGPAMGTFTFVPLVGNLPLEYNREYANSGGREFKFTKAQVYIAGLKLDGSTPQTFGQTNVTALNNDEETLNKVLNPGDYTGLSFQVGLDSILNHSDPSQYDSDNPLSNLNPDFEFWSQTRGYRFIVLEGYADTTADANGPTNVPFEYHIGADTLMRKFSSSTAFTVEKGDELEFRIEADFGKFFNNIDLRKELVTHTNDDPDLAKRIAGNVTGVFRVKKK